jgi:predicted DNA-binding transcriptional regulator AlpA
MAATANDGRPPRLARMNEVTAIVRVTRRGIEKWIVRGEFPAPVKIGKNSIVFPLDDPIEWARTERKSESLAAQFERLAYIPIPNLKPQAVEAMLAKRLSRQYGERFTPDQVVYGAVRQATEQEALAIHATNWAKFVQALDDLFADLDPMQALLTIYGLYPSLRPWFEEMIKGSRRKLPPPDVCRHLALQLLAMSPMEREQFKRRSIEAKKAELTPSNT